MSFPRNNLEAFLLLKSRAYDGVFPKVTNRSNFDQVKACSNIAEGNSPFIPIQFEVWNKAYLYPSCGTSSEVFKQ
jgi:hypothetical protein